MLTSTIPITDLSGLAVEELPARPIPAEEAKVQVETDAELEARTEPRLEIDLEPASEPLELVYPEEERPQPTQPLPKEKIWAVSTAVLALLLVYVAFFKPAPKPQDPPESPVADKHAAALASASTWLESASQSLSRGDFKAAVTQYEKGLEFLKDAEAEREKLEPARMGLAEALEGAGKPEDAYDLWRTIQNPRAPEKLSQLSRLLCQRGDRLLAESKDSERQGDLRGAESRAKEAVSIFFEFEGTDQQKASALERLARVYMAQNRTMAAESELKKAQRLVYSKEREKMLTALAPAPVAPKVSRPRTGARPEVVVVRKRPSLGLGSTVPQAAKHPPTPTSHKKRKVAPQPTVVEQAETAREDTDVPLGQRDVLESYRTTRRKTGNSIPGLR